MTPALAAAYLESLVPALGWTLANFLWQGALVALILRLLLKACRSARARHDLALGALLLMASLPVATFAWLRTDVRIVLVQAGLPGLDAAQNLNWEAAAVAAWLTGVAALAVRTAGGLLLIERLRRGAKPLPAAWAARCRALHVRMQGSLNVAFAQSEAVAVPLVAGWLKPMVLIPTSALTRLPVEQLEALILHELAHVRRLDAVANLIQSVVETALFYHPAVWWVSRRVRVEREHCCDDMAVAAVGDPALYVRALHAIETARGAPFGVLAAGGGDLKSRAARILGLGSAPERPPLSRSAAILILTAAAAAATHGAAVQAKPVEGIATPPAATAARPAGSEEAARAVGETRLALHSIRRIMLAQATLPAAVLQPVAMPVVSPAPNPEPSPAAKADVPRSVSTLVVPGRGKPAASDLKIEMQGSEDDIDQLVVIWPATAYHKGTDGHVTLSCLIDVHGLAEWCRVTSERPLNQGFGRAALELRPTLKLDPARDADGEPVNTTKSISIRFKAPDFQFDNQRFVRELAAATRGPGGGFGATIDLPLRGNRLAMRDVTMLDYPVWVEAASFDDLARAYPAKGGGAEGYAVAHCQVRRTGALFGCQVIKETPSGKGFGKAALDLAPKFRVAPQLAAVRHSSSLWVDIPMRLPPPSELAERTITAPTWITGVDPKTAPKVFPPEAVAAGVTSGRGIARCTVAAGGAMTGCAPESAEPAGLGFGAAAARLASRMKMNLWSLDGAPVEGGVVHIPVRLNLKGA